MVKVGSKLWAFTLWWALLCGQAIAAGGEGGTGAMVVVADTRSLTGVRYFIGNLYNYNLWLSGLFCIAGITLLGAGLGLLMDFLMRYSGLDLGKARKREH